MAIARHFELARPSRRVILHNEVEQNSIEKHSVLDTILLRRITRSDDSTGSFPWISLSRVFRGRTRWILPQWAEKTEGIESIGLWNGITDWVEEEEHTANSC